MCKNKNSDKKYKYWYAEYDGNSACFPLEEFPTKASLIEKIEDIAGFEVIEEDFNIELINEDYKIMSVTMQPSHYECIEVICPYCNRPICFDDECGSEYENIKEGFELYEKSLAFCPYRECGHQFMILDEINR